MGGITPKTCEAPSRLTYDERQAVKPAVDSGFSAVSTSPYESLCGELGPMTCGVTGLRLVETCSAIDR